MPVDGISYYYLPNIYHTRDDNSDSRSKIFFDYNRLINQQDVSMPLVPMLAGYSAEILQIMFTQIKGTTRVCGSSYIMLTLFTVMYMIMYTLYNVCLALAV